MAGNGTFEQFSLFGGPLHRMGERLGLVHGGRSAFALGLALGLLSWTILCALALIEGVGYKFFSLPVIAAHVRLLIVIPLLFLCESLLDARLREFVSLIARSGVVPKNVLPALEAEITRTNRWRDSLVSRSNVPRGDRAVDFVCSRFAPVWKNNGIGPWPGHKPISAGWPVVLDGLPAALSFSGVSLALADRALVVFPLARGEIGTPPRGDLSRWRRWTRISRSCADLFHPVGPCGLGAYVRVVRGGDFLWRIGLRGDLPGACDHSYHGSWRWCFCPRAFLPSNSGLARRGA